MALFYELPRAEYRDARVTSRHRSFRKGVVAQNSDRADFRDTVGAMVSLRGSDRFQFRSEGAGGASPPSGDGERASLSARVASGDAPRSLAIDYD
jgi:hypothetical protein